jgi:hypothetical protein
MNTKFYSGNLKGRDHLDSEEQMGANNKMDLREMWCQNMDCSYQ